MLLVTDSFAVEQMGGIVYLTGIAHVAHLVEFCVPGNQFSRTHGVVTTAGRDQHAAWWQIAV